MTALGPVPSEERGLKQLLHFVRNADEDDDDDD